MKGWNAGLVLSLVALTWSAACVGDRGTRKVDSSAGALAAPMAAPMAAAGAPTTASRAPRRVEVNGVDLTGIGYDVGSATAPVVLVNFSDFGCPFCGSFARQTAPAIEAEYVRTGKVFLKYVPFVAGMFPNSRQASRAAECAGEQGKFWGMHDRLYTDQAAWKRSLAPYGIFKGYADAIGLDASRFGACYTGATEHPRTAQATEAADRLGVRVTPTLVVNGRAIEGALPLPQLREVLDAALAGGPR